MKTTLWYAQECGRIFSQKFYKGIIETVEAIAAMPSMGILDERRSNAKTKYYSFPSHPKYRIVYRYDDKNIYVVGIRAMRKEKR